MAVERPNLERVRVEAQERLDLPDFDALQDTIDDGSQLALGALMGPGGGCLSPFHVALTAAGNVLYMEPTTFQFYWSQKAGTAKDDGTERAWRGGVLTYDPLREGQQAKWEYTAYVGQTVYMYARPKAVDAAVDGRRKFIAGAPVSTSVKTRKKVVVEFKFSSLAPNDNSNVGWAPVAYINSWNGNTPSIKPISVWDSWVAYGQANQPANFAFSASTSTTLRPALEALDTGNNPNLWADFLGAAYPQRSFGLAAVLLQIRARLKRFLSKTGGANWYEDPPRSFDVLDGNLLTAETKIADLYARPYLKVAGYVLYTAPAAAGSYTITNTPLLYANTQQAAAYGAPTFTRLGTGIVRINAGFFDPASEVVLNVEVNNILSTAVRFAVIPTQDGVNAATVLLFDANGAFVDDEFFVKIWCRKI